MGVPAAQRVNGPYTTGSDNGNRPWRTLPDMPSYLSSGMIHIAACAHHVSCHPEDEFGRLTSPESPSQPHSYAVYQSYCPNGRVRMRKAVRLRAGSRSEHERKGAGGSVSVPTSASELSDAVS